MQNLPPSPSAFATRHITVMSAVRVVLADLSDAKAAADWTLCTQMYACGDTK